MIILSVLPFPSHLKGCREKGGVLSEGSLCPHLGMRQVTLSITQRGRACPQRAANSSDDGGCLRDSQLKIMPPQERGSIRNSV